MEVLMYIGITIVVTVIIGVPLVMLFGYITYCDPADDFHKLLTRIRKRSWE